MRLVPSLIVAALALLAGCASRPMFVGPPTSLPEAGAKFSAGASWAKPVDSSNIGVPQVHGAMHMPVSPIFDLAVRAWSLGAGMQGRVGIARRSQGNAVDLMLAPLLGVSTVAGLKAEDDERLLPPLKVEFLITAPLVLGIGIGSCSTYVGVDPNLHVRPDEFALKAAALAGFACPTKGGMQIAPELVFEMPIVAAKELRPEDGFLAGEQRHPWMANVVRVGVAFSF